MPLANAIPVIPSSCLLYGSSNRRKSTLDRPEVKILSFCLQPYCGESDISGVCSRLFRRKRRVVDERCRYNAADTRVVDSAPSRTSITGANSISTIDIPVTCYQIIGVSEQAEKDEVVKSVMNLKKADVEEGYTMEAIVARQDLLMDVRDKLLFEPEYAGNIKEKITPKSPLRIPWAWLPGALCLLQEVGEEKLVLDIGRAFLRYPDAKPYIHDLLLSMALAECAIAKVAFENNKVSQGFEALARAQSLLKSKITLGKMTLLSEIEESLEELAPACTLELLGLPHSPENAERRRGAIAALRELLRQGLDVEASCQVQDWSCFLSQALTRLMASEIVDLLSWDSLAITRKNKKSLECQNQRIVIDFNCFYMALIAHIAVGFSSKQTELINKAKTVCECLMASEGVDLKFEEAFCSFVLGQGTEAEALEKLKQLESKSDSVSRNPIMGKETRGDSSATPSLESWLKDSVLAMFPDTRDCSPSLANFFRAEKKHTRKIKKIEETSVINRKINLKSLSSTPFERRDFEDSLLSPNSSRHICSAVTQLASTNLQNPLISAKNIDENNASIPSVQLKRNLGFNQSKIWEQWLSQNNVVKKISFVVLLGATFLFTLKLSGMKFIWPSNKQRLEAGYLAGKTDSLDFRRKPNFIEANGVVGNIKKLLAKIYIQLSSHSDSGYPQSSSAVGPSSSTCQPQRTLMPMEEAEELVRQWESIKAEALGSTHQVHSLLEILDESMLDQWQSLAETARARSCYWRFVLLQLTVLQAEILSDNIGGEMAEVEALIEEAAELIDESRPKNAKYYSTYKIRYILKKQDDGSWKFCESQLQKQQ